MIAMAVFYFSEFHVVAVYNPGTLFYLICAYMEVLCRNGGRVGGQLGRALTGVYNLPRYQSLFINIQCSWTNVGCCW